MRSALLCLLVSLATASAAAQPRWVRVEGTEPRAAELRSEAETEGWTPVSESAGTVPGPSREALVDLARAETLIAQAREASARLREGQALDALAEARTLVERHARTPGVTHWLAEVELATGVVAHQQRRHALAEQSLERAASLDPTRQLGAAEAPPPVVRRARELARAAASRPQTRLALRSDAPGARAFLDDRPLGPLPVEASVEVGRHVLRIEAPGHRTWGRIVDLTEGRRGPWTVALSPDEREQQQHRLAAVSVAELPAALDDEGAELRLVQVGEREVLVTHCTSAGCAPPRTREPAEALDAMEHGTLAGPVLVARWDEALEALDREPLGEELPPPPRPWWRKGTTWVAVALGAVVAGVALGFSLRRDARQELRVIVDTDDL